MLFLTPDRILSAIGGTLVVAISIFALGAKMRGTRQARKGIGL